MSKIPNSDDSQKFFTVLYANEKGTKMISQNQQKWALRSIL